MAAAICAAVRTRRCSSASLDPGECGAYVAHPMCTGWGFRNKIAPDFGGLFALPILLGSRAQIVAGAHSRIVERNCALEGSLRIGRYNSICLRHQGLAEIGFAICALSKESQCISPGVYRIRIATELHIDRCQKFPAAAVFGIVLEMILDLGDDVFNRRIQIGLRTALCDKKFRRKSWRT